MQSFWVNEIASPSEERIMTDERQDKDLEKREGDRTHCTQTQRSSEGEIESVPIEGVRKTVPLNLVQSK